MSISETPFLTAEWRKLILINYAVDPEVLKPYVPFRTEMDLFHGRHYVSLVGFMFLDTRIKRWIVPFHRNFEEVNLRFYVRQRDNDGAWKRGVVFIREIVPKRALTWTANVLYGENYVTMPMMHRWEENENGRTVEYSWKSRRWNRIEVRAGAESREMPAGSEAEFIAEHYYGYTRHGASSTTEYKVEHPRWVVYPVDTSVVDVDFEGLYGGRFAGLHRSDPVSVFLAEGSPIKVFPSRRLR